MFIYTVYDLVGKDLYYVIPPRAGDYVGMDGDLYEVNYILHDTDNKKLTVFLKGVY